MDDIYADIFKENSKKRDPLTHFLSNNFKDLIKKCIVYYFSQNNSSPIIVN